MGPAFTEELERASEELSVERRRSSTWVERMLGSVAKLSGGVAVLSALTAFVGVSPLLTEGAAGALVVSLTVSFFSSIAFVQLRGRHSDVDTAFWARLWKGRIGKLAFAIARQLVGTRVPQSAATHRATELTLGMAAEQLFESLPKSTRQALGDVPGTLKRLQEDAHALRLLYDQLQEGVGDAPVKAATAEYADLVALRDETGSRLTEAVGALETIRLNLLRLHAGSATVEGLTTHLGLAADVSEQVARLIAAHVDIEEELGRVGGRVPTPV